MRLSFFFRISAFVIACRPLRFVVVLEVPPAAGRLGLAAPRGTIRNETCTTCYLAAPLQACDAIVSGRLVVVVLGEFAYGG